MHLSLQLPQPYERVSPEFQRALTSKHQARMEVSLEMWTIDLRKYEGFPIRAL